MGLLAPALILGVIMGARFGAVAPSDASPQERALFGAVVTIAVVVVSVRVLGAVGGLHRETIFGALFVWALAAWLIAGRRRIGLTWRGGITSETIFVAIVAAGVLVTSISAAYLLPIWQWDALGYHLPYVNFALQGGGFSSVPEEMAYISAYPHVVENFYLAWRAMLPDDRFVDAAQIPFGLVGVLALAVLAHQAGARRDHAAAAGLLWLTIPVVFLQLPTNYVDVAAAALLLSGLAFSLARPAVAHVIAAGVAFGLYLGSKPSAPIAVMLMFSVLAVRGWQAGRRLSLGASLACMLLLGAESYVTNFMHHGNPIWPVQLEIGPFVFPGRVAMDEVLASGCEAPRIAGHLALRIIRSWTALDAPPMFDMRYGGLGATFLMALPAALVVIVRRRSIALAVTMVATLASPDPAIARYILAFPGLVLALAATQLSTWPDKLRRVVLGCAALASTVGLYRAYPGLTGEGPALDDYVNMPAKKRLRAVGAEGSPAGFYDALERMEPGTTAGFDSSLELALLAWPPDLSTRAVHISDRTSRAEARELLSDQNLTLLIVAEGSPVADEARLAEPVFTELFRCRSRLPPSCLAKISNGSVTNGPELVDMLRRKFPSCVVLLRTTQAS